MMRVPVMVIHNHAQIRRAIYLKNTKEIQAMLLKSSRNTLGPQIVISWSQYNDNFCRDACDLIRSAGVVASGWRLAVLASAP